MVKIMENSITLQLSIMQIKILIIEEFRNERKNEYILEKNYVDKIKFSN